MCMSDPIADMLTRIRNAQMARKQYATMVSSRLKIAIANVLKEEGYIDGYRIINENSKKTLEIALKYYIDYPVIENIKRISKPGLRIYKSCKDLPQVMTGLGTAIVSTSKGVMTQNKARELGVGGELLCILV